MGSWYKRPFAWLYHTLLSGGGQAQRGDLVARELCAPLLAQARGDVLEIGAGDGATLPFYSAAVRLTLLEPNPYLLAYLCTAARRLGRAADFIRAEAEAMPFPDGRFDTIVAVHVLCSVRDQPRTLAEIRRVLRSGGRFLFLEHVAAPPGTLTFAVQRLMDPVWRRVGDGCRLTRDTAGAIHAAGFREVVMESHRVGALPIVAPHIVGWSER